MVIAVCMDSVNGFCSQGHHTTYKQYKVSVHMVIILCMDSAKDSLHMVIIICVDGVNGLCTHGNHTLCGCCKGTVHTLSSYSEWMV